MFRPGCKTLSVGRLGPPCDEAEQTGQRYHRISGWFGIFGAMIASMDYPPTGKPTVLILGLCKLSPTSVQDIRTLILYEQLRAGIGIPSTTRWSLSTAGSLTLSP